MNERESFLILIIDDSPEDRELYCRLLRQDPYHEYEILETDSGHEGLAICRRELPDCVLLDYRLPDLDGLEFLRELGDSGQPSRIAVVMLTGQGAHDVDRAAMESGAQDYLVKDQIDAGLLARTIRHAVDRQRTEGELRYLKATLEQRVEERTKELHRLNATLLERVEENSRLIEQFQAASRIKTEFLGMMSHELRTPLHAVVGFNDILREELFGPLTPKQRDAVDRIACNAQDLLGLIEATLDIAKLDRGQVPLKRGEIHPEDLMRQIESGTPILRRKRSIEFAWHVAPDVAALQTDAGKLKIVVKNLVENAVKFTEQGSVKVEVRNSKGGVEFSIADTGIGIAPEVQSAIFEPFRQIEHHLTRRYGGAGLGLYITRRLLEAIGGSVSVQSEPGKGSVFRVWVPVRLES
jgi:signal transduction histidine kinase